MSDIEVVLVKEEVPIVTEKNDSVTVETNTTESVVLDGKDTTVTTVEIFTVVVETDDFSVIVAGQPGPEGPIGPPGISEENMVYARQTDFFTDNIIYKGEAEAGTLTSAPLWRIRKVTIAEDNDVSEIWADGDTNFDNIWDNRLSLTYI